MQLVDCFISLIAYVRNFQRSPIGESDALITQIDQLIASARSDALAAGISNDDIDTALFAVIAWIDEIVLISTWQGACHWQRNLLQKRYFNVTNAGNTFFTRLEGLMPEQLHVREIYYLCLAMGFVGRYGYDRDLAALTKIKNDNLLLLLNRHGNPSGAGRDGTAEPLFPDGYLADHIPLVPKTNSKMSPGRWRWQFSSLTKSALLVPICVLLTLYATYYLIIWQVTNSILKQIP